MNALLVEDAHGAWHDKHPAYRNAVTAWMRSEGIDPTGVRRIEVFLVDTPFAKVTTYVRHESGGIVWHAGTDDPEMTESAVLLSSLPPLPESGRG